VNNSAHAEDLRCHIKCGRVPIGLPFLNKIMSPDPSCLHHGPALVVIVCLPKLTPRPLADFPCVGVSEQQDRAPMNGTIQQIKYQSRGQQKYLPRRKEMPSSSPEVDEAAYSCIVPPKSELRPPTVPKKLQCLLLSKAALVLREGDTGGSFYNDGFLFKQHLRDAI